jgi:hypothetical protein
MEQALRFRVVIRRRAAPVSLKQIYFSHEKGRKANRAARRSRVLSAPDPAPGITL